MQFDTQLFEQEAKESFSLKHAMGNKDKYVIP